MGISNRISRRNFLIGAAGIGAAACAGAGILAVREPQILFAESDCETSAASPGKTLVAYASQFGTTGEVAVEIARTLCARGISAKAQRIDRVPDLSPYQAVIVGSAVHSNAWMPEAMEFVRTHRNTLASLPSAYFLTCMTIGLSNRPEEKQKMAGVLDTVKAEIPEVTPICEGLFAGALDYDRMSLLYRTIYQIRSPYAVAGDFRDWPVIHSWADMVGNLLSKG